MKPQESLLKTIGNKGAIELLKDYGEIGLDLLVDEGILRDVPIFGTAVGLFKIGKGIKDHLFIKKLTKFIIDLENVTEEERSTLVKEIEADEKYRSNFALQLLGLIDRLDDIDKTDVISKLFLSQLKGKITLRMFFKYAGIIDKMYLPDLELLNKIKENNIDEDDISTLQSIGLIKEKKRKKAMSMIEIRDTVKPEYELNKYGDELCRIIFE